MRRSVILVILLLSSLTSCSKWDKNDNTGHYVTHSTSNGDIETFIEPEVLRLVAIPVFPVGLKLFYKAGAFYSNSSIRVADYSSNTTWSSSDNTMAPIDPITGLLFAKSIGMYTISAYDKLNKFSPGSDKIAVVNDILEYISVSIPHMVRLPINTKEQLHAYGTFKTLGAFDLTRSVHWTSSNEAVVHIVDDTNKPGLIEAVASTGSATITASWNINGMLKTDTVIVEVSNAKLDSCEIIPTQLLVKDQVPQGVELEYSAIGHYNDGHIYDITNQVNWQIQNLLKASVTVATINQGRVVTLNPGDVVITACTNTSASASVQLKVSQESLTSIYIEPAKPIGQAALAIKSKLAFKAMGVYTDGSIYDITQTVRWHVTSTNNNLLAVSNIKPNIGVVTAIRSDDNYTPGYISATKNTPSLISSNKYKLVTTNKVANDLAISPNNQVLHKGIPVQYRALSYESIGGYQLDLTDSARWVIKPNYLGSFSADGLLTPKNTGSGVISAKFKVDNDPANTDSKVDNQQVKLIAINSNGLVHIAKHVPLVLSVQATLTDGTVVDITSNPLTSWISSNPRVIDYAGVNNGHFISKESGTAVITALYNNPYDNSTQRASLAITVDGNSIDSISITPIEANMVVNDVQEFNATLNTIYGSYLAEQIGLIYWSSSNPSIVSINPLTGVARALSVTNESVVITAKLVVNNSLLAQAVVHVFNPTLRGISIRPAKLYLTVGDSQTLSAAAIYTNPILKKILASPSQVRWSVISPESDIAKINTNGKLIALKPGNILVQTQLINAGKLIDKPGAITSIPVTITESDPFQSLEIITNDNQDLAIGEQRQYKVIAHYRHHDDINVDKNSLSWSSDNPNVAVINSVANSDSFGRVTAISGGVANISAILAPYTTKGVNTRLIVNTDMKLSYAFISGPTSAMLNDQLSYYAYVNYSLYGELYKSIIDVTNYGDWYSYNGSFGHGKHKNDFIVLSSYPSLSFFFEGADQNLIFVIKPETKLESLVITSVGTNIIHVGDSKGYGLTAFYNNIGSNDVTSGATWITESLAIANIDDGILTAIRPGITKVIAVYNGVQVEKLINILAKPTVHNLAKIWLTDGVNNYKSESKLIITYKGVHKFDLMAQFSDGVVQKINPFLVKWTSIYPSQVSFNQGRAIGYTKAASDIALGASYSYNGQTLITPSILASVPAGKLTKLEIKPRLTKVALGSSYDFSATGYFDGQEQTQVTPLSSGIIWQKGSAGFSLNGKVNIITHADFIDIVVRDLSDKASIYANLSPSIITGENARLVGVSLESAKGSFTDILQQQRFRLMAHYVESDLDHYVDNKDVIWGTRDESIIAIDSNGMATSMDFGAALVTGTYQDNSSNMSIKVEPAGVITSGPEESKVYNAPYTLQVSGNGPESYIVKYSLHGPVGCATDICKEYPAVTVNNGSWQSVVIESLVTSGKYTFNVTQYKADGITMIGESIQRHFIVNAVHSFTLYNDSSSIYVININNYNSVRTQCVNNVSLGKTPIGPGESTVFTWYDINYGSECLNKVKYSSVYITADLISGHDGHALGNLNLGLATKLLVSESKWYSQIFIDKAKPSWLSGLCTTGSNSSDCLESFAAAADPNNITNARLTQGLDNTWLFKFNFTPESLGITSAPAESSAHAAPYNLQVKGSAQDGYIVKYSLHGPVGCATDICKDYPAVTVNNGSWQSVVIESLVTSGKYTFNVTQYKADGITMIGESLQRHFIVNAVHSFTLYNDSSSIYAININKYSSVKTQCVKDVSLGKTPIGPGESTVFTWYDINYGSDCLNKVKYSSVYITADLISGHDGHALGNLNLGLATKLLVSESKWYSQIFIDKAKPSWLSGLCTTGSNSSDCLESFAAAADPNNITNARLTQGLDNTWLFKFNFTPESLSITSAPAESSTHAAPYNLQVKGSAQDGYIVKYSLHGPVGCATDICKDYPAVTVNNGSWQSVVIESLVTSGKYTFNVTQYKADGITMIGESLQRHFIVNAVHSFTLYNDSSSIYAININKYSSVKTQCVKDVSLGKTPIGPGESTVFTWYDINYGSDCLNKVKYSSVYITADLISGHDGHALGNLNLGLATKLLVSESKWYSQIFIDKAKPSWLSGLCTTGSNSSDCLESFAAAADPNNITNARLTQGLDNTWLFKFNFTPESLGITSAPAESSAHAAPYNLQVKGSAQDGYIVKYSLHGPVGCATDICKDYPAVTVNNGSWQSVVIESLVTSGKYTFNVTQYKADGITMIGESIQRHFIVNAVHSFTLYNDSSSIYVININNYNSVRTQCVNNVSLGKTPIGPGESTVFTWYDINYGSDCLNKVKYSSVYITADLISGHDGHALGNLNLGLATKLLVSESKWYSQIFIDKAKPSWLSGLCTTGSNSSDCLESFAAAADPNNITNARLTQGLDNTWLFKFNFTPESLGITSAPAESSTHAAPYNLQVKGSAQDGYIVKYSLHGPVGCATDICKEYPAVTVNNGSWQSVVIESLVTSGKYTFNVTQYKADGISMIGESIQRHFIVNAVHSFTLYNDSSSIYAININKYSSVKTQCVKDVSLGKTPIGPGESTVFTWYDINYGSDCLNKVKYSSVYITADLISGHDGHALGNLNLGLATKLLVSESKWYSQIFIDKAKPSWLSGLCTTGSNSSDCLESFAAADDPNNITNARLTQGLDNTWLFKFNFTPESLSITSAPAESSTHAAPYNLQVKGSAQDGYIVKYSLHGPVGCATDICKEYPAVTVNNGSWQSVVIESLVTSGKYTFNVTQYKADGISMIGESIQRHFIVNAVHSFTLYNDSSSIYAININKYSSVKTKCVKDVSLGKTPIGPGESTVFTWYDINYGSDCLNKVKYSSVYITADLISGHDGHALGNLNLGLATKLLVSESKWYSQIFIDKAKPSWLSGLCTTGSNSSDCLESFATAADPNNITNARLTQGLDNTWLFKFNFTPESLGITSAPAESSAHAAPYNLQVKGSAQDGYIVKYSLHGPVGCATDICKEYPAVTVNNGSWQSVVIESLVTSGKYTFSVAQYKADGITMIGESIQRHFIVEYKGPYDQIQILPTNSVNLFGIGQLIRVNAIIDSDEGKYYVGHDKASKWSIDDTSVAEIIHPDGEGLNVASPIIIKAKNYGMTYLHINYNNSLESASVPIHVYNNPIKSISVLQGKTINMVVGGSINVPTLMASSQSDNIQSQWFLDPLDIQTQWQTGDTNIAKVQGGRIIGVKSGTTTLMATYNGKNSNKVMIKVWSNVIRGMIFAQPSYTDLLPDSNQCYALSAFYQYFTGDATITALENISNYKDVQFDYSYDFPGTGAIGVNCTNKDGLTGLIFKVQNKPTSNSSKYWPIWFKFNQSGGGFQGKSSFNSALLRVNPNKVINMAISTDDDIQNNVLHMSYSIATAVKLHVSDSEGRDISSLVHWVSSKPDVLRVSVDGVVQIIKKPEIGSSASVSAILADDQGHLINSANLQLTISSMNVPSKLELILLRGDGGEVNSKEGDMLHIGNKFRYRVKAYYGDNTSQYLKLSEVVVSSSDPSAMIFDPVSGLVTVLAPANAVTFRVGFDNRPAVTGIRLNDKYVTISSAGLIGTAHIEGTALLYSGQVANFTLKGNYPGQADPVDITYDASWYVLPKKDAVDYSLNPAIINIVPTGIHAAQAVFPYVLFDVDSKSEYVYAVGYHPNETGAINNDAVSKQVGLVESKHGLSLTDKLYKLLNIIKNWLKGI